MAGNGKHTSYKNGDDWGMVYACFTMSYPHSYPLSTTPFPYLPVDIRAHLHLAHPAMLNPRH